MNYLQYFKFGMLEQGSRKKYKLTEKNRDRTGELVRSTNGVRKGVWVYDVTEEIPRSPELCPKTGK